MGTERPQHLAAVLLSWGTDNWGTKKRACGTRKSPQANPGRHRKFDREWPAGRPFAQYIRNRRANSPAYFDRPLLFNELARKSAHFLGEDGAFAGVLYGGNRTG